VLRFFHGSAVTEFILDDRIYGADQNATDEFEMPPLSLHQKLNAERVAILAAFEASGRAYAG
jgi:hypothetical protein